MGDVGDSSIYWFSAGRPFVRLQYQVEEASSVIAQTVDLPDTRVQCGAVKIGFQGNLSAGRGNHFEADAA
jgi:hypothetical protein